jgi:phage-related protein
MSIGGSAKRVVVEFFGEDKSLGHELGDVESRGHRVAGVLSKVGKAAAVGLAGGFIAGGAALVGMTKNAIEDEASVRKLALALHNSVGATDAQVASVEKWISKVGVATGVTDDELRPAFQRLVQATGDIGKAQKLAQIAMDASAGSGKSLKTVTEAIAKAQNGNLGSLSRLGIQISKTTGDTLGLEKAQTSLKSAQLSYNTTLKAYGADSAQASIAADKLRQAHEAVALAQDKTKKTTLTFDQAMKGMADTFQGQAAAKADSLSGKMDRLRLIIDEAKESIGYKLIPIVTSLADWILNKAVPAVGQFTNEWQKGIGTAGQVREVLAKIRDAVVTVSKFLWDHKAAVAAVVAAYLAFKVVMVGVHAAQAISLVLLKAHTVGTIENTVVTKVAAAASKAWAAAQWLLNAALDANPIGLVVIGVAALAAGVIIAYKHSETFRAGVQAVGHALMGAIDAMSAFGNAVNNKVAGAVAFIRGLPAKLQSAFGDPGHILSSIGAAIIQGLIGGITSQIGALENKLHEITHLIPLHKGPLDKDKVLLTPAGEALIEGLIAGIDKKKSKLESVLNKLTDYIKSKRDKVKSLMSDRDSFAAGFSSFGSSIFGADISGNPDADGNPTGPTGVAAMQAFAQQQRAQAEQLQADVKGLLGKGLSQDLIKQLAAQGESGIAQIHALAGADTATIHQFDVDNAATQAALKAAGMLAANDIYSQDIRDAQHQENIAQGIAKGLKAVLDQQDKNMTILVTLDGHEIHASLRRIRRQTGQGLGLDP